MNTYFKSVTNKLKGCTGKLFSTGITTDTMGKYEISAPSPCLVFKVTFYIRISRKVEQS